MAGGALKYRHLNRTSSHRQALLRNLVTSLITHESIQTTWPKAKEAQRLAEKLITLGKKDTHASRARAESILYEPLKTLPTLFTTLRQRYLHRPGGYTRVLRIEPLNHNHDQAPSAILELVDGPRDMRFAMTAKTLVRERAAMATGNGSSSRSVASGSSGEEEQEGGGGGGSRDGGGIREITAWNVAKVTRFRPNGEAELEREVRRLETMKGLGKPNSRNNSNYDDEVEDEDDDDDEYGSRREPWEPFARMRQRAWEKADEERPLSAWERRELLRPKRDPDSGRRAQQYRARKRG